MQTPSYTPTTSSNGGQAERTEARHSNASASRDDRDASPAGSGDGVSAVSREVTNVIADAEDLIKATTSLTGEDLARIRSQLAKGIEAAKESIKEMGGAVTEGARKAGAATNAEVHQQPWRAIGISAAAAFVLGLLIARRH